MDRVSKSSLNVFLQCQRKYYYSLLGIEPEKETPEIIYGTQFHELLESYNKERIKGNKEIKQSVDKKFLPTFQKYIKIVDELEKQGFKITAAELPVGIDGLFGYIDALFYNEKTNKYLIIDFKTLVSEAYNKADIEKYRLEINIYTYILMHMKNLQYRDILGAIIIFEQNGERAELKYINNDGEKFDSAVEKAKNLLDKVMNSNGSPDEFPKISETKSESVCMFCPYYNICR